MTTIKKEGSPTSPIWTFFDKWKKWDYLYLQASRKNSIWCTAAFYWKKCKIEKIYWLNTKSKKCEEIIKIILL